MIAKLPRWVWWWAWVLAFIAGMVNAVGFLSFNHQAVTHLTGTTTLLALSTGQGDWAGMAHFAAVLGSFLTGAVLSGLIIQNSVLQLGRRYGIALGIETGLLLCAVPLLNRQNVWGIYAMTMACGLQNAMISTYSGATVRTTHVSGMFTDLGIFLGHFLRGVPVDYRRLRMCGLVITGFFCGGCAGTVAFHFVRYSALFVPALLTGLTAIGDGLRRLRHSTEK